MKPMSQRRAFMSLMCLLAPAFAVGVTGQKYARQADVLTDSLKIAVLITVSTAIVGFVIWTFLSSRFAPFKSQPLLRGAIAGLITAFFIIPLPAFGWSLKNELLNAYQSGQSDLLMIAIKSVFISLKWGLLTFVEITKASLTALIGSSVVGAGVAHYVPKNV